MYIYDNISLNSSFRVRNISDKFDEKIKTHISYSITFSKNRTTYEIVWNIMFEPGRPQATI